MGRILLFAQLSFCVLLCLLSLASAHKNDKWGHGDYDPSTKKCYVKWKCFNVTMKCPPGCARCTVNCDDCKTTCGCNKKGAICQDPRFVGGDGVVFYFHGKKDADFCIVADNDLHINAHFIGKEREGGAKRDFTWVQALGIMFGDHKLYVGAKKVAIWDENVDQLELSLDNNPVFIPAEIGQTWKDENAGVHIMRTQHTNTISIHVPGSFRLEVSVVPITDQDSRIHNYGITKENCFAHLDLNLKLFSLSDNVDGVLGQTYAPGYISLVNSASKMPVMGGAPKYASSDLMKADCAVSRFGFASGKSNSKYFPAVGCGSSSGDLVCRR